MQRIQKLQCKIFNKPNLILLCKDDIQKPCKIPYERKVYSECILVWLSKHGLSPNALSQMIIPIFCSKVKGGSNVAQTASK